MFDIWKRGVHPFDSLREMTSLMPNTPTSMLIRSNALNSMAPQPRDVVESFVKLSVDAGVNVFTNFDAHNDVGNNNTSRGDGRKKQGGSIRFLSCSHSFPSLFLTIIGSGSSIAHDELLRGLWEAKLEVQFNDRLVGTRGIIEDNETAT